MTNEMIDGPSAAPIAVFYRSIPKTIAILVLSSAPTAFGASIVLGCILYFTTGDPTAADYVVHAFWLLCGLLLFLVGALLLIVYLEKIVRALHGPIIEVSHSGIRDRRISPDIIPWSSIESMWRLPQTRGLLLILDATVYNSLPRSGIGAWARHRRLKRYLIDVLSNGENPYDCYSYGYGFGDVSISMVDLVGSFEALVRAVEQAWGVIGNDSWSIPSRIVGPAPQK